MTKLGYGRLLLLVCGLGVYNVQPISADDIGYQASHLIVLSLSTLKDSSSQTLEALNEPAVSTLHLLVTFRSVLADQTAVSATWKTFGSAHPEFKNVADLNVLMFSSFIDSSRMMIDLFAREDYSAEKMSIPLAMMNEAIKSMPQVVSLSIVATRDFDRSQKTGKVALRITSAQKAQLLDDLRRSFPGIERSDKSKSQQNQVDKVALIVIEFYSGTNVLTEDSK